jgi:hypothetical protein
VAARGGDTRLSARRSARRTARRGRSVASGALVLAVLLSGPLAAVLGPSAAAQQTYPPGPSPDAGPITPDATPDPAPTPRPPAPRPTPPPPAPDPGPTDGTDDPRPLPPPVDPNLIIPSPPPSPDAPGLQPGGIVVTVDGEEIDVRVRPAPGDLQEDDPVLRDNPFLRLEDGAIAGFLPRDDGSERTVPLDAVVIVEAGPLGLAIASETCAADAFVPVGADGALVVERGGRLVIGGSGTAPLAEVSSFLYSQPIRLADSVADEGGVFDHVGPIPADQGLGRHVVQITAVGSDLGAYRISLDVLVTDDCVADASGLRSLLDLAGMTRLLLAMLLLAALGGWFLLAYVRRCILVGLHPDLPLPIVPGQAALPVPPLPVSTRGKKQARVDQRSGRLGFAADDRALVETELRLVGDRILDLDETPVPVASTTIVESGRLGVTLAIRRPDGVHEPLDPLDGQLRARDGGTLVLAICGASSRARIRVSLREAPDRSDGGRGSQERSDEERTDVPEQELARLRADGDGLAFARLPLPDDLGDRPMFVKICVRDRRFRRRDEDQDQDQDVSGA